MNDLQQINNDPVVEFFAPLANESRVSVGALIQVVVNKLQNAKKSDQVRPDELIQYAALCKNAGLDPATSEVSPLVQRDRISLIIGVDGWTRIANRDPNFDGIEYKFSDDTIKVGNHEVPKYIDTYVYFKNRSHASFWRTPYDEAFRSTSPVWASMPLQMLQNRATTNAIKRAFGLSGVVDSEDVQFIKQHEVDATKNATVNTVPAATTTKKKTASEKMKEALMNKIPSSLNQTAENAENTTL